MLAIRIFEGLGRFVYEVAIVFTAAPVLGNWIVNNTFHTKKFCWSKVIICRWHLIFCF